MVYNGNRAFNQVIAARTGEISRFTAVHAPERDQQLT